MSEPKCPKCGGEMKSGQLYPVHFRDKSGFWGSKNRKQTYALACKSCGYIELYIERKEGNHE